jgi:hypothetical protein
MISILPLMSGNDAALLRYAMYWIELGVVRGSVAKKDGLLNIMTALNSLITGNESVMIATGDNHNLCFFHLVDKAMLSVNTARPATGKLKAEGFRFSCSLKRCSPNPFKKR